MTDYSTMSGAEFKRAVGADPEKWAVAFIQRAEEDKRLGLSTDNVAQWFRDFGEAILKEHTMEAAVKAAGRQEWPPSD